jgi:hypothetical protein
LYNFFTSFSTLGIFVKIFTISYLFVSIAIWKVVILLLFSIVALRRPFRSHIKPSWHLCGHKMKPIAVEWNELHKRSNFWPIPPYEWGIFNIWQSIHN